MASFLSQVASFAAYLQKSWIIEIAILIVAALAAGLLLIIRYSRRTNNAFRVIGFLFLAWDLCLGIAKLWFPTVKVPSTALVWTSAIGITFLVAASLLRRQRLGTVRNRIDRLSASTAERIDRLRKEYDSTDFVDLMTYDGKLVIPLLSSLMHPRKRGRCTVLLGQPWSGRTATLLNSAVDLQQSRSAHKRPLIAMYIDLDEYATQTTESLPLGDFIQRKFGEFNQAMADTGRDVRWVFLFDNADEADRRWGKKESWNSVTSFIYQRRLAPFYAVVATRTLPRNPNPNHIVELGGLSDGASEKLLTYRGVNQTVMDELAKDKSLYWYLTNPGALKLLAPVFARCSTWTTSDNAHKAMGGAIKLRLQGQSHSLATNPSSLQATAMATIELLQTYQGFFPGTCTKISDEGLAHIAKAIGSSSEQVKDNLTALEEFGIVKWTISRDRDQSGYVEFSPAIAAYFYTCILLESPGAIPVDKLLRDWRFRLTAVSLLKMADDEADNEIVPRFLKDTDRLLNEAIRSLPIESAPSGTAPSGTAPSDTALDETKMNEMAYLPYAALSVLVEGLQNRLGLLDKQLRKKSIEFTKRATPFQDPRTQAGLLKLSYSLGTREETISTMKVSLKKQYGTTLFDITSRMVNTISESEVTELDDVCRSKLVRVIILVGLRSLNVERRRDDIPSAFRLADTAGITAIILYGILFGLGGLLQLIFWHSPPFHSYPFPQICEILAAVLVVSPMLIARYRSSSHNFVLGQHFQSFMRLLSRFLALVGAFCIIAIAIYGLMKFTLPLMPLLVCYSLAWPACVLSYLTSARDPKTADVIFPLPQIVPRLWHNRSWSDLG